MESIYAEYFDDRSCERKQDHGNEHPHSHAGYTHGEQITYCRSHTEASVLEKDTVTNTEPDVD